MSSGSGSESFRATEANRRMDIAGNGSMTNNSGNTKWYWTRRDCLKSAAVPVIVFPSWKKLVLKNTLLTTKATLNKLNLMLDSNLIVDVKNIEVVRLPPFPDTSGTCYVVDNAGKRVVSWRSS